MKKTITIEVESDGKDVYFRAYKEDDTILYAFYTQRKTLQEALHFEFLRLENYLVTCLS